MEGVGTTRTATRSTPPADNKEIYGDSDLETTKSISVHEINKN
jgi:hypothetical protein